MPNLGTNTAGKALIVATSRLIHHQLMKLPSIKQPSSMLSQSHSLRISGKDPLGIVQKFASWWIP
jgi:hypothetical protein